MGLAEFAASKDSSRRSCAVGGHPARDEIDAGIAAGIAISAITEWTQTDEGAPVMSYATVRRHARGMCCCDA